MMAADSQQQQFTPAWNAPGWSNMLRQHAPLQQIPVPRPLQQVLGPQGPLAGQSLFAALTPAQLFWLTQLMGRNVGQSVPASPVDPWQMMQLLQGPQAAVGQDQGMLPP